MSPRPGQSRGGQRERAVKKWLEQRGYVVIKSGASLKIDLVAARAGEPTMAIEVKGTKKKPGHGGTWTLAVREQQRAVALQAGWEYWLAWWPPHGELQWLHSSEWSDAKPDEPGPADHACFPDRLPGIAA